MVVATNVCNGMLNEALAGADVTTDLAIGSTVYVALHYNMPGGLGASQTVNELSGASSTITGYINYARVPIVRSAVGWTVSNSIDNVTNALNISFPQRSSAAGTGDAVATHYSIGVAASGSSAILFQSPLTASGAVWLPCIVDSAGNVLAAGADFLLVALPVATTLPADLDPYEVMQLYDDGLPTGTAAPVTTNRHRVKAASQTAMANSKLWTLKLQGYISGAWTDLAMTDTYPNAFQIIKAAPLTITVNQIPTISAGSLTIDVSG